MNKQRTFKLDLTYNEIMMANRCVDEFIIAKDVAGVDVMTDSECIALRELKGKLLDSYIKGGELC